MLQTDGRMTTYSERECELTFIFAKNCCFIITIKF